MFDVLFCVLLYCFYFICGFDLIFTIFGVFICLLDFFYFYLFIFFFMYQGFINALSFGILLH